ncbi:hypothetical protein COY95_04335 [Candidatus Woesearchaeota archaeon CG_4_10_14_0_8_um_filter_47_5]|nr:MAG: hypothetical protein COY95_04335 [Candidatus Woesearchaeota archaeon CG_4_10_14_0_8_um_filter_47_5]
MIRDLVKKRIKLLANPEKELNKLRALSLESAVYEYAVLLITLSILSGISVFVTSMLKALYLDLAMDLEIQYWRLVNYTLGRSTAVVFFYLFAGTFILFTVSILFSFLLRKVKYTRLMFILLHSLTPVLLFGWIPLLIPSLLLWSLFIFVRGVTLPEIHAHDRYSIKQRD